MAGIFLSKNLFRCNFFPFLLRESCSLMIVHKLVQNAQRLIGFAIVFCEPVKRRWRTEKQIRRTLALFRPCTPMRIVRHVWKNAIALAIA